ncbi:MAG: helix-turn-helix transcriptional regulator [Ruminococcaceae bacterium]|nr:helix-turn-helix transcriptional regulator [Oscillospiraceae bacterium]
MSKKEVTSPVKPWSDLVVTEIDHIITVPSERGRHLKIQDRSRYGLSFCHTGQISYTINGNRVLSNRDVAVLLPRGGTYELHGDSTGSFPLINFQCLNELPSDEITVCHLAAPESYLRDYERLLSLWTLNGNRAEMMALLYDMLARLAKEGAEQKPHLLTPAIEYLGQNLGDPALSNAQLAHRANMSEVYFRRVFKETYGTTPHRYVMDLRIRRAKQLLTEGPSSVTAIAESCGFSSVYHFCRAFKAITGLTPSEYARKK